MDFQPLPFYSTLDRYRRQAEELLHAHLSGGSPFQMEEAQLTLARWYGFASWQALAEWVDEVSQPGSSAFQFEPAVEAVIAGDLRTLESLLRAYPELVRERSTRTHRATLLHYVAANGVEGYRQKTSQNAPKIAETLLRAGAEVDAFADMYGGPQTTMNMLVSSCPPAQAGVQVALVETLLDFSANIEGYGTEAESPLMVALAFGYLDAARKLVERGAKLHSVAAAAGLGSDFTEPLLAGADADSRHRALALAAQHGHVKIVRLLLDAGEDPNRYNPHGIHPHSTPLHQAALAGHDAVVRLLVERGARMDIRDTIYQGTPLGWAKHAGRIEIANYLSAHGG